MTEPTNLQCQRNDSKPVLWRRSATRQWLDSHVQTA